MLVQGLTASCCTSAGAEDSVKCKKPVNPGSEEEPLVGWPSAAFPYKPHRQHYSLYQDWVCLILKVKMLAVTCPEKIALISICIGFSCL